MKSKLFVLVCAIIMTLGGCAASRGVPMNDAALNQIQRGITTENQIRQMFGEPTSVSRDSRSHTKVLTYNYHNQDYKSEAAGLLGAVAGGALGNQIGQGSGRAIATAVGVAAGGMLAGNMVGNRKQEQNLAVYIDTRSGIVTDYRYEQYQDRRPGVRFNEGVGAF